MMSPIVQRASSKAGWLIYRLTDWWVGFSQSRVCAAEALLLFSLSDKKRSSAQRHTKKPPETALILERRAETGRDGGERKRQTNKDTQRSIQNIQLQRRRRSAQNNNWKMFLGLLKPIKIKCEKISYTEKKKKMCQRSSFICSYDTVLSNNKSYVTIAFTVLEEIYFLLPAQKTSALHSSGNRRDPNKGNNLHLGITR